jgi:hypothetical protein
MRFSSLSLQEIVCGVKKNNLARQHVSLSTKLLFDNKKEKHCIVSDVYIGGA